MSKHNLSIEQFLVRSETSRVIPIIREVFSGTETPVGLYEKLAAKKVGSFLLESAEQGVWSRFSFIGVESRGRLIQETAGKVTWTSQGGYSATPADLHLELPDDALSALELVQSTWYTASSAQDIPLVSGLVGHIGWDMIRDLESLAAKKVEQSPAPRMIFSMFRQGQFTSFPTFLLRVRTMNNCVSTTRPLLRESMV